MSGDPNAAERVKHSFLDTLMRGHSDAAWAIIEMKMMLTAKMSGGWNSAQFSVDERLKRTARRLRDAANHIDAARGRLP